MIPSEQPIWVDDNHVDIGDVVEIAYDTGSSLLGYELGDKLVVYSIGRHVSLVYTASGETRILWHSDLYRTRKL